MNKVELMTIEDTFMIESIGLLVMPLFEVKKSGKWEDIVEDLSIQTRNEKTLIVSGLFQLAHFNIKDGATLSSECWKIQLVLQNRFQLVALYFVLRKPKTP